MPKKDGYETALWLKRNQPDIKVLALSMYDDENAIIRMLKNGARGYILKDAEPEELKAALCLCADKRVSLFRHGHQPAYSYHQYFGRTGK